MSISLCTTANAHKQLNAAASNKSQRGSEQAGKEKAQGFNVSWQECIPSAGSHSPWKCPESVSQWRVGTLRTIPITSTTNPPRQLTGHDSTECTAENSVERLNSDSKGNIFWPPCQTELPCAAPLGSAGLTPIRKQEREEASFAYVHLCAARSDQTPHGRRQGYQAADKSCLLPEQWSSQSVTNMSVIYQCKKLIRTT